MHALAGGDVRDRPRAYRGGQRRASTRTSKPARDRREPRFLWLWDGVVFDYELFDRYVLERDLARVERFYRARGFYEAHARAGRVERTKENHVAVTIEVDEGEAVKVGDVHLEGITTLPIDDAAAALEVVRDRLKHDQPFDEDNFNAAEQEIQLALTDRGYAFARAKGEANVDSPSHVADVTFAILPGPKCTIGSLTLEGLESFRSGPCGARSRCVPARPIRRASSIPRGGPRSASTCSPRWRSSPSSPTPRPARYPSSCASNRASSGA